MSRQHFSARHNAFQIKESVQQNLAPLLKLVKRVIVVSKGHTGGR